MDRHFRQAVGTISDAPDGALDDGLPVDHERVGRPLVIDNTKAEITLVRVSDWIGRLPGFVGRRLFCWRRVRRPSPRPAQLASTTCAAQQPRAGSPHK
jgi:hypothetical protein